MQFQSVILFLFYLSIEPVKMGHRLFASRPCNGTVLIFIYAVHLVKINQREYASEGNLNCSVVRKTIAVYLFAGPLLFCQFLCFPSRADWIILSRGSRISVGSLRRIRSPRKNGLKERVCEGGEERKRVQMAELLNV